MANAAPFLADHPSRRAQAMGSCSIPEHAARLHATESLGRVAQGVEAIASTVLLVFPTSRMEAVGLLAAGWLDLPGGWEATLTTAINLYAVLGGLLRVAWTDTLMPLGRSSRRSSSVRRFHGLAAGSPHRQAACD